MGSTRPIAGRARIHAEMWSYSTLSRIKGIYKLQDSLSSSLSIHRPWFTIASTQAQTYQIHTYNILKFPVSNMPPRADMSFVERSQSPVNGGDSPRPCPPGPPPSPANGPRVQSRHELSWGSNSVLVSSEFDAMMLLHGTLLTSWNPECRFSYGRWTHTISKLIDSGD